MASAPAPAPASGPPWTCLSWPPDLNDPLEVRFWPPFHASKAGCFGTAIMCLIVAVVAIVVLLGLINPFVGEGGKRNVKIAIAVVAFVGLFMVIGFSVLGMNYVEDDMDENTRPGIFKKNEQCGFVHSPWLSIVAIPGAVVLIGVFLMIYKKKEAIAQKFGEISAAAKEKMGSSAATPEAIAPAA